MTEKKGKGLSKRAVTILIIIAIILASFAVVYNYFDLGEKFSNNQSENLESSSGGKVGIVILPPEIEDKGALNG